MSKEKITFLSNSIEDSNVFAYFGSVELIEHLFKIQYAWEDGSYDSEVGDLDINKVLFNGTEYTDPLKLTFAYDNDESVPKSESFSKCSVQKLSKQELHQLNMWKLEQLAMRK